MRIENMLELYLPEDLDRSRADAVPAGFVAWKHCPVDQRDAVLSAQQQCICTGRAGRATTDDKDIKKRGLKAIHFPYSSIRPAPMQFNGNAASFPADELPPAPDQRSLAP